MNMVLLGSRGYLGQQFLQLYPDAGTPTVDIGDQAAVRNMLDQLKPEIVINCAGKTGRPNVDWCEDHKEETLNANVTGALILLEECIKRGIYLVHMSSGCIYTGDNGGRGFTEDDPPNFFGSFYSRTKAWSDQVMKDFPVLTLRLRMPFDGSLSDRNLLMKLRKYGRVLDVPNSFTYLPDFLRVAGSLIRRRATGLYNVTNPGALSPYDAVMLYKEIVDPQHAFERLTLGELSDVVKAGRSNCILSTEKLAHEGMTLLPAEAALREALMSIAKELRK